MIFPLAVILAIAPVVSQQTITREGTPWVASTWGYSTPKLLCDGRRLFAVGLVGTGMDHDVARLYWRDADTSTSRWQRGADLSPVYQPATILLDELGYVHVFATQRGVRGFHWQSKQPGDVSGFHSIDLPSPEKFSYGYLGVGRGGDLMALAGVDASYTMWITTKRSTETSWAEPVKLIASQKATQPWTSPVYPIVLPRGNAIDVVTSNCPDGGVHNTYDRVEITHFDLTTRAVTHQTVAQGPLGEMTYCVDALRRPDGSIAVLYFSGLHVYGDEAAGIETRRGLFCSIDGKTSRISASTGTAQLDQRRDGRLEVYQSSSTGAMRFISSDAMHWTPDPAPAWSGNGGFLYLLKSNSGSVMNDGVVRGIQSVPNPAATAGAPKSILEYVEMKER